MENHASLFVNTSIIMVCVVMAIVFLTVPLPPSIKLKKYRISLRFLAGAYIILAILKAIILANNIVIVEIISMERLTISSLQATLFAIAMITLINPVFVTNSYLIKQILPVVILNILYFLLLESFEYIELTNYTQLFQNLFNPIVLIREIFVIYYIFQLFYLTKLFFYQFSTYKNEINNYFSEGYHLYLPWIKYSFFCVLFIGVGALFSCFILSELCMFIYTIIYGVFYLVFGVFYIQYPNTFMNVQPAIYPQEENKEITEIHYKRHKWDELKNYIIEEKIYLKAGVTIEDISHFLKIGRTTLSMYINNEEGMNFNMWINKLRIEEAKKLFIKYPNYNLIDISEMVGFSESSNFSRQFKIITNETPSFWRQNRMS